MSSPESKSPGYTESLATKMERLADALNNGHTGLRSDGVYVDVYANGNVRAVVIDDPIVLSGRQLGIVIADLINRAREQAQAQVEDLVQGVRTDPRVISVVEQLGDAPERGLPRSAVIEDPWEEDDDPYRRKSRIRAD